MAERTEGICTECGEEDVEVTIIDEETQLCDDCLDNSDYVYCDECEEYWDLNYLKIYHLTDGRTLCEHCAEMLLEDGDISEDDIESIDGDDDEEDYEDEDEEDIDEEDEE